MYPPFSSPKLPVPRVATRPDESVDAGRWAQDWRRRVTQELDLGAAAILTDWADNPVRDALLTRIAAGSPYLSRLLMRHIPLMAEVAADGVTAVWQRLIATIEHHDPEVRDQPTLMRRLRRLKAQVSLLIAWGDLAGEWTVEQVTEALSLFADRAVMRALDFLLMQTANTGDIALQNPSSPSKGSGFIVLGMGKLGARELNYSSDIDLIVLYDEPVFGYRGSQTPMKCAVELTRKLVAILHERTEDGYVFRTDLRLRPDPASTPLAVTTAGAVRYYETVGQNWERAALIKARQIAGDMDAGAAFLREILPFVWRKSLDYLAIDDIRSIKRQIEANQAGYDPSLLGFHLKLGVGGIREIEFFAQTQQLIWGGREPNLRKRATCRALMNLAHNEKIEQRVASSLIASYRILRTFEHRLQMVDDQQTHSLPPTQEEMERFARFCGYESADALRTMLTGHLESVQRHYRNLFPAAKPLSAEGNLVFTGVEHDPATLETLKRMGFSDPATVSELIRSWHHGRRRATRTKRARELITEILPTLLRALGKMPHPDSAFLAFDEFLANLPAGVQLFSLLSKHPQLLELIASIMGKAPDLGRHLSRNPSLLDGVLSGDFYNPLPTRDALEAEIARWLDRVTELEPILDSCRTFRAELQFRAGVHLLQGLAAHAAVSRFLSDLAEVVLGRVHGAVTQAFEADYGVIPGSGLAIVAMGKLGSREMTFGSDLDLVFVYDAADDVPSTGERSFTAGIYYTRLAQRIVGALTAASRDGKCYEVDLRLRPNGKDGPLAVSLAALGKYVDESAWTWERMALTRARPMLGDPALLAGIEAIVRRGVTRAIEPATLAADILDMRERLVREKPARGAWDLKYVRGGIIDLEFLAQFLQLRHGGEHPEILRGHTGEVFTASRHAGLLSAADAQALHESYALQLHVFSLLRLCNGGRLDPANASPSLTHMLAESTNEEDFASLGQRLEKAQGRTRALFEAAVSVS